MKTLLYCVTFLFSLSGVLRLLGGIFAPQANTDFSLLLGIMSLIWVAVAFFYFLVHFFEIK